MVSADVDAATEIILRAHWGDRRAWFEFAVSQPECQPVVAVADREIVGTGVGTANGRVGWVGTIWVATSHSRHILKAQNAASPFVARHVSKRLGI